jgi:hypothetical protein
VSPPGHHCCEGEPGTTRRFATTWLFDDDQACYAAQRTTGTAVRWWEGSNAIGTASSTVTDQEFVRLSLDVVAIPTAVRATHTITFACDGEVPVCDLGFTTTPK